MARKKCPPAGLRVCFTDNPVVRALYSGDIEPGECGRVVAIPVPGGKRTCLPGPMGGLVYVDWDRSSVSGAFPAHLRTEGGGRSLGRASFALAAFARGKKGRR